MTKHERIDNIEMLGRIVERKITVTTPNILFVDGYLAEYLVEYFLDDESIRSAWFSFPWHESPKRLIDENDIEAEKVLQCLNNSTISRW
jgi:hypothetical protein